MLENRLLVRMKVYSTESRTWCSTLVYSPEGNGVSIVREDQSGKTGRVGKAVMMIQPSISGPEKDQPGCSDRSALGWSYSSPSQLQHQHPPRSGLLPLSLSLRAGPCSSIGGLV